MTEDGWWWWVCLRIRTSCGPVSIEVFLGVIVIDRSLLEGFIGCSENTDHPEFTSIRERKEHGKLNLDPVEHVHKIGLICYYGYPVSVKGRCGSILYRTLLR